MSFTDRLLLWLHIGFAIFTIGPVTLAISSTPRYIRKRDLPILRYLTRITTIFVIGSLAVLIFGVVLGDLDNDFSHPWLTAALTLFLVALVLLVLIMRDQRKAIRALEAAARALSGGQPEASGGPDDTAAGYARESGQGASSGAPDAADVPGGPVAIAVHVASVERGRIAGMGGIVNLIWLAILALMIWQP